MRISDWSSDVCSSDLDVSLDLIYGTPGESLDDWRASVETALATGVDHVSAYALVVERSEERRVGKACVRTCRSRWSPYHKTTKILPYSNQHEHRQYLGDQ